MSTVKIPFQELDDKEYPTLCMLCGEKEATTQFSHLPCIVGFPLNLFGILGTFLTPKKYPMTVVLCNGCKVGFATEKILNYLWKTVHLAALILLGYVFQKNPNAIPESLRIPGFILITVLVMEVLHFWTLGRKFTVRMTGMDKSTVSLEFPNGKWGVAYTTYKREQSVSKSNRRPQTAFSVPAGSAAAPPTPPAAPPPAGAPTIGATAPAAVSPFDAPTPTAEPSPFNPPAPPSGPVITHAAEDVKLVAFEGSELAQIPDDLTEFFQAIKMGDTDLVTKAVQEGADRHQTCQNGMTGLHVAALAGVMPVVDLLLRGGLQPNAEMQGGLTPMHLAVQSNNHNVVGLLLAKKGDPNHKNAQGRTPLHWCAAVSDQRLEPKNRLQIAQMLRRGGADVTLRDETGKTPTDWARESGDTMLTEALS